MTMPTANPQPGGTASVRDVWCAHAQGCLSVAAKKGWGGLSCGECKLYGKAREQDLALARDGALRTGRDLAIPMTGTVGSAAVHGAGGGGGSKHISAINREKFQPAQPVEPAYEDPSASQTQEVGMDTRIERPAALAPPVMPVDPAEIEAKLDREQLLEDVRRATRRTGELTAELSRKLPSAHYVEHEADGTHIVERTPLEQAYNLRNEIRDLDRRRSAAVKELEGIVSGLDRDLGEMKELLGREFERAGVEIAGRVMTSLKKSLRPPAARRLLDAPAPTKATPARPAKKGRFAHGSIIPGSLTDRILKAAPAGKEFTAIDLAKALHEERQKINVALFSMRNAGHVVRVGTGVYKAAAR